MENDRFPPLEPGTGIDPRVCIKETTLRVPWKTLEFLGFLEAHLCQTTVEPVGTLVAAAKSYG